MVRATSLLATQEASRTLRRQGECDPGSKKDVATAGGMRPRKQAGRCEDVATQMSLEFARRKLQTQFAGGDPDFKRPNKALMVGINAAMAVR